MRSPPKNKNKKDNISQNTEHWSTIMANLAQLAMLGMVVFGYFYTVKPVFQKEKLEEDIAKLELEKANWINEKEKIKDDVKLINQEKEETLISLRNIESNKNQLQSEVITLSSKTDTLQKEYKKQSELLTNAENEYYKLLKSSFLGETKISVSTYEMILESASEYEVFEKEKADSVAENLSKKFIQPIDLARKNLKSITENSPNSKPAFNSKFKEKLAQEYENNLNKKVAYLQCKMPDFKNWQTSFKSAFIYDNFITKSCIKMHINEFIKINEWSEKDVKKYKNMDFYIEQEKTSEKSCLHWLDYKVRMLFIEKWQLAKKSCTDRIFDIDEIVLKNIEDIKLLPEDSLSPPSKEEINKELIKFVEDWIKKPSDEAPPKTEEKS